MNIPFLHCTPGSMSNRRCTKLLIGRSRAGLMWASLVFKALSRLVFFPIIYGIWSLALRFSPAKYIVSANIKQLLVSPLVIVAIVVIALLFGIFALLEISLYLSALEFSRLNQSFGLFKLFLKATENMKGLRYPHNWPMLFFAAVLVPFTNLFFTATFVSQLVLPEYIMEVVNTTPLYHAIFLAVSVVASIVMLNCMFVFHFFILKHQNFWESVKNSIRTLKGKRIRMMLGAFLWSVEVSLKYILCFIPLLLLFVFLLQHFASNNANAVIAGYQMYMSVLLPGITFLLDVAVSLAQYSYLSVLFYRSQESEDGSAEAIFPDGVYKAKSLASRVPMLVLIGGVAAGCFLLVLGLAYLPANTLLGGLLFPEIEVTSHRGYSAVAPENTLPAFQAAIDCGAAQYAELDVQMTKDGVVVLTHDTNLKRCTGRDVNVYDITYEDLQKLDAGSFFSEEFSDTQIPTLDQVIKLCKDKIKLNIEIKQNGHSPTLESETARIILDNDFADQCVITSLDYESLEKVKEAAPQLETGYILAMGLGNYYDLPAADFFSVETTFINQRMVSAIHARGKTVHAWTVDTSEDAEKMIALGVNNIITGDPVLIHKCIMEQKVNIAELLLFTDSEYDRDEVRDLLDSGEELSELLNP